MQVRNPFIQHLEHAKFYPYMKNYESKTKEELLEIIQNLEKKIEDQSVNSSFSGQIRFRDKYSTQILDALPDMLTVFDHNANIVELASSPATNHVEGTNSENIIHANVKDIVPEDAYESVRENMENVIRTGQSSIGYHHLVVNGETHYFENRIFPLDDKYLLCMCRDISLEVETRKKAENAERLKSAFLANMSHEIRTPLNAIVGFSKLIIDSNSDKEKQQYADIVERNTEVLLNLFNDILDLSALEADSLEFSIRPIKIVDICLQLYEQYRRKVQNDVKLILDPVDTLIFVSGDWKRIMQIITNLLSNAIKFTSSGEIHYGFRRKENFVEFYVKDTGIGISPHKAAQIFERFGKINDFVQGTGLGLALCRMIVEKMGGRIWLRSVIGEGSKFYFTLPIHEDTNG